ncbi:hypothetical protein FRC12_024627 [Ceratobasidium sp. 428]|nr:hypothetical protein FRC12_024627 [Ceratobasidium sp. 428]
MTQNSADGQSRCSADLHIALYSLQGTVGTPEVTINSATQSTADVPALAPGSSNRTMTAPELSKKTSNVTGSLCRRKNIRGRATVVFRIYEVMNCRIWLEPGQPADTEECYARNGAKALSRAPEQAMEHSLFSGRRIPLEAEDPDSQQPALQLMWRDPWGLLKGETLKLVRGNTPRGYRYHKFINKHRGIYGNYSSSWGELEVENNMAYLNMEETTDERSLNMVCPVYYLLDDTVATVTIQDEKLYVYFSFSECTIGRPLYAAENPQRFLQGVLDAVLSYWCLVNKGLLHRDISDGNMLLIDAGQGYSERGWKNSGPVIDEANPELAESQALLQKVLCQLGRDPTSILSDFDLSTTHSRMSVKSSENETETEIGVDGASSSNTQREGVVKTEDSSLSRAAGVEASICQYTDFRTGTPTFMAVRVLKMEVDSTYTHHFMDDLESFFWLIVWCVAQHVDEGKRITTEASVILNQLDRSCLSDIPSHKAALLSDCFRFQGSHMKKTLDALENAWATNPGIIYTIIELGTYFFNIDPDRIFDLKPAHALKPSSR